ncbi:MAG TPA: hypothetical protein VK703_04760 [Candidatus Acidoferrales bacterium]|jgi:hypothetical protein|nr:hypothetical protein [Candidatus Acidoferrales bacterium]
MRHTANSILKINSLVIGTLLAVVLLTVGSVSAFAQKAETIEAAAMGTGTQLGQNVEVRLIINDYSTMEERQVLVDAFTKGQNQGLVTALQKMRAVGRISLTGTVGYDVSFIRMIPTPTGRKIRFITNRPIRFGEAWTDSQTMSFDLSGGEIDINDSDKSKSTGVLYPRAQLVIDKQGQLQIDLSQNPWKLVDVLDWKGTPGVN